MQDQEYKEQFFSQIYDQDIEKIYRFVLFKVSSETLAQDITSEAFSRLWKQISADKEVKNPTAFLYRTARNLLIDYYRNKDKEPVNLDDFAFSLEDKKQDIEKEMMEKDDRKELRIALASLKDDYRQVVSLYYIEQESISDIAKSLGKSEGATRVLLHRGIKKLQKILEA